MCLLYFVVFIMSTHLHDDNIVKTCYSVTFYFNDNVFTIQFQESTGV